MKNCKIIFADLDGTLLRQDKTVSAEDIATLEELGKKKIFRVLATGRSLYSLGRTIEDNFPHLDYVVFSCGVGIMNWNTKEILRSHFLVRHEIENIRKVLEHHSVDYMIHKPVPDNHKFHYKKINDENHDFDRRFSYYSDCGIPLTSDNAKLEKASEVLAAVSYTHLRAHET